MKPLSKLKKNKDAKRLASNFFSLTILQVAGYIFPLLTVPYLAHVIGVDYYGEIAFASAIMVYFQTVVDYGFIFSAVRDIARVQDDKEQVSLIYSRVMWSRFALLCLAFILLTICTIAIPKLREMWILLNASFLIVIGHTLFPDWLFQALERMKYITIFNLVVKLIFTVSVFIFIQDTSDYILQPIFTGLGFIISGTGAMWVIRRWGIRLKKPEFIEIKRCIKSNFDLFLNQIVPNLYNSASVLLLGFTHGDAANGVFDAANRFNTAGSSFLSIISRTFYPFLSRRMDKHTLYRNLNLSIASIIAITLFLLSPWIIHTFFPTDFDGSINVLRLVSISLIFLAMNNIYGTNYLILNGYEKVARQIVVYSSIIGMLFAIPLVYFYSYMGVAITIVLSRGIMAIWSWLKVTQIKAQK